MFATDIITTDQLDRLRRLLKFLEDTNVIGSHYVVAQHYYDIDAKIKISATTRYCDSTWVPTHKVENILIT